MKRVLLGLGSNRHFGELLPIDILRRAVSDLSEIVIEQICSSVYKSKAMYVTNQEDFYNMAGLASVDDSENPYDFLDKIHRIEAKYGRDRSREIRNGPRTLDIDIELFGDLVSGDSVLTLPHPRILERAFVMIPALEIMSDSDENKIVQKFQLALKKLDCSEVRKI